MTTWRIAASTGCCVDRPITETLGYLHEGGVRAAELGTPPRHFDPWRHEQVLALDAELRRLEIAPIAIHAPFGGLLDLSDPNPHHRHAAIGAIVAAASALHDLGGSRIVVHATDVVRNNEDVEARLTRCTEALGLLARACRQLGMQLVVETPLPHLIGGRPDELASVMAKLDRSVGVCFDTSHATLGHHWDRHIELLGDRLVHVHANDHRGQFDDHLMPGDGIIDWRHIRDTLVQVKFDDWIVLELACPTPCSIGRYFALATERILGFLRE